MTERTSVGRAHPGVVREDELELVRAAQEGCQQASSLLVRRYGSLVRCKARSYFLVGAERDDVMQEGMIGLFKAIRDYDPDRQTSFRSFADLCVTRQIITAIKTATRQKHTPLNGYISLNRPVSSANEGERLLEEILAAKQVCDPAQLVISAWETEFIYSGFTESLSDFESRALRMHMDGRTYQEIADALGRHTKSVDNALQRVKRKVEIQVNRCRMC